MDSKVKKRLQTTLSIGFFALMLVVGARLLALEDIEGAVRRAGVFAPLALIVLKASTLVIAPLGGAPVYLVAAKTFDLPHAILYLFIGDFIGHTSAFFLGRIGGRRLLSSLFLPDDFARIDALLGRIGTWRGLFVSRIVFIGLTDFLNYAAGFTRMSYLTYLLATVPFVLFSIGVFMGLGEFLIADRRSFLIVTIALLVMPVFWGVARRLLGVRKHGSLFTKFPLTLD